MVVSASETTHIAGLAMVTGKGFGARGSLTVSARELSSACPPPRPSPDFLRTVLASAPREAVRPVLQPDDHALQRPVRQRRLRRNRVYPAHGAADGGCRSRRPPRNSVRACENASPSFSFPRFERAWACLVASLPATPPAPAPISIACWALAAEGRRPRRESCATEVTAPFTAPAAMGLPAKMVGAAAAPPPAAATCPGLTPRYPTARCPIRLTRKNGRPSCTP